MFFTLAGPPRRLGTPWSRSTTVNDGPAAVPERRFARGVGCFLARRPLRASSASRLWPLTAFRLFSVARDDTADSWEATTSTPKDRRDALSTGRAAARVPPRGVAAHRVPGHRRRTRAEVCEGIARGARDDGHATSSRCACTGCASRSVERGRRMGRRRRPELTTSASRPVKVVASTHPVRARVGRPPLVDAHRDSPCSSAYASSLGPYRQLEPTPDGLFRPDVVPGLAARTCRAPA